MVLWLIRSMVAIIEIGGGGLSFIQKIKEAWLLILYAPFFVMVITKDVDSNHLEIIHHYTHIAKAGENI